MQLPPELARTVALASGKMSDRVTVRVGPSQNNLHLTVRKTLRRVKTPEYRKWLDETLPLLAFLKSPVSYPCKFCAVIHGKLHHARDLDNTIKVLLDGCKAAKVIEDDKNKYVRGIDLRYEPGDGEPRVTIWFESITQE